MDLKECLSQYCDLKNQINDLEKKISKLENKERTVDVVDSSMDVFPFLHFKQKVYNHNPSVSTELEYLKIVLKERYGKALEKFIEIEEFINSLPTPRLQMIFEYRYVYQFSWVRVAIEINKNRKGNYVTAESIRKEHDRFLEKN